MSKLTHYHCLEAGIIDPEEIRRLVKKGRESGLISDSAAPAKIDKSGTPVATSGTQRTQWMDISPAIAADWLKNNFRNRPLAEDTIIAYARDMAAGAWVATHQGIAFNDQDQLIDGQHRLHAIIRSGRTVRMMVTFGLPSQIDGQKATTMDAVDRGRIRSVADQLKIQHGLKNGSAIAAICASIATLCQDERTRRLSVGQTLEIYRDFQDSIDWVIQFRPMENGLRSKGVLAACAFALHALQKDPITDLVFNFFRGSSKHRPLQLLREFLVSEDAILLNRGTDRGLAELTLQALHLALAGEAPFKLELSQAGLFAFRALQPARVAKIAALFHLPQ